jgi:GTPase SAR1 family protein
MNSYEDCRTHLEKLKEEFLKLEPQKLNDANTRFKLIDGLLKDCLNWGEDDISCEDNYKGKYTDYILSIFRSVAVVEAKKTGDYFELPVGKQKLFQPLKSVYKDNPNIKSAIDQVMGYCHTRSIQIGIVCNGWQIIAFIANRNDSIPPLEGNALVVPSLDVFHADFKEIWNCLSKSGIETSYLKNKLLGKSKIELPPKLSSTIHHYPGIKNRNPFQIELEIISDLVLEDVIKDKDIEKEFLLSCYCKSGALSNYSLVSKEILATRYNYLFEAGDRKASLQQVATKKGISSELVELFAESLSKRPVLLVGDVGVGKSTFIDYLRLVEAPKVFEKAISFKIDLGSRAIIALDMKVAIIELIREQLSDIYNIDIEDDDFVRHCYFQELKKFQNNIRVKRLYEIDSEKAIEKEIDFLTGKVEDEIGHLKSSLSYICKNQSKQIIIFIDNCDQRSDQDQESAFLIAQEFSSDWPMIVFISIRPETFHRTKRESGALSGYHTKAFTIPPPRIDDVIKKRLAFAQKITSGEISLTKLGSNTRFSKLHTLIDAFLYSVEVNANLLTFLNNVSNENIRKAIELVKKFFGSGHVDMEKIITIFDEEGRYNIPLHELLRSVIYGDNIHYSPSSSDIVNVFDIRHPKPNDHFILLIFISLLDDYSKNSRNHGFVSVEDVYTYMQGLGFNSDQIDSAMNFAYLHKLFETSQKGDQLDAQNAQLLVRATNSGIYHLRFLIQSFTYIDSIIVDTPILEDSYKDQINDEMSIEKRLVRATAFKKYLDDQWQKSKLESVYFSWIDYSSELQCDIERISARIEKNNNNAQSSR